ncbi:MAG: Mu-like prophage major head subunit gpT family protein [Proteobacteria bacterium]|nr:Mu-like prophage major head subunit gpT family protein [Pseudomonadota bacterium]
MKKIKINKNSVRAFFIPDTFDAEKRTVDITWSVGAKGKRYSWSIGEYFEELSMKKGDVDLSRLNNGAPVLKDHRASLDTQFGVVESAKIKSKEGIATVRFSEREEFQGLIKDIESGIVRNVSVGYRVHKYQDVTKKGEETPTYRAVSWTPMELSFVAIGFDDAAQSRSAENENDTFECDLIEFNNNREIKVENENTTTEETTETPAVTETPESKTTEERSVKTTETTEEIKPVDTDAIRKEGSALEKTRQTEITSAVKASGLDNELAVRMIDGDNTIDETRKEIIIELEKRSNKVKTQSQNVEVMDVEKRQLVREAATRAILHRENPSIELKDGDRQFMGGSLLDTAREVLTSEGVDVRGINGQVLSKRALHSSSDFGLILENVSNKSLRDAYDEQPQTFSPFVRETSAKDFKEMSRTQLGEGSGLEKVNEHGEYKRGTLGEGAEKYKVEKYGKILGFTWELLVNDDMDAFSRVPAILGRKVRAKESELIYNIINSNPLMADGNALYSAAHGNLGAAAVIGETSMTEAKSKMRLQKDIDGELIMIEPKFLYVPTTLETAAKKFMATISPTASGDVNIFANSLQVVVEPRLDAQSATAWYLMAEKGMLDIVELARLGGQGPQMFTREGFDIDGMETKIRYVFGVKAIDHRGMFKNAGV